MFNNVVKNNIFNRPNKSVGFYTVGVIYYLAYGNTIWSYIVYILFSCLGNIELKAVIGLWCFIINSVTL